MKSWLTKYTGTVLVLKEWRKHLYVTLSHRKRMYLVPPEVVPLFACGVASPSRGAQGRHPPAWDICAVSNLCSSTPMRNLLLCLISVVQLLREV